MRAAFLRAPDTSATVSVLPQSRYRVAGRTVVTDRPIDELSLFERPADDPEAFPVPPSPPAAGPGDARVLFAGSGWVADGQRRVECRFDGGAYRLAVGGVGELWVAADGRCLGCGRPAPGLEPRLARLALIGPALTLALAAQGTFCLHASAVETPSGVFAFAGESGAGKSTLARMLAGPPLGYRRVADDLLPLDPRSEPPVARADFPQLKLKRAEQPFMTGPPSLPLRAVFVIGPPAAGAPPRESVEIEPLTAKTATLALVRHTVASRLFDPGLLERHLQASAALARAVLVRRLSYPWGEGSPQRIAEAIEASCS